MKPSYARRYHRRSTSRSEGAFFKKEFEGQSFFSEPAHQPFFGSAAATIQRKCDKCDEEEKASQGEKKEEQKIQRKEIAVPASFTAATSVTSALNSSSQTLPGHLAYRLGSRMGADFSDTKIHVGNIASRSAKAIRAKAYTLGNHIVFGEGQFRPDTPEGKRLLAHELAHVVQQRNGTALYRAAEEATEPAREETAQEEQPFTISTQGDMQYENTTHYANCDGVSVSGLTNANYSHSQSSTGEATLGQNCAGCTGPQCISITGNITSTFRAAPTVSLPAVPGGLSECETAAVRSFINTTLTAHEQQHVAAFNTYTGTVTTPYTYNGCRVGLNAFVQARHNAIEAPRRAASDALSAALDANGANRFNITCNCPDPTESSEGK